MAAVTERPILFRGEMVRAILDGRKSQTRRVVRLPPLAPPLPFQRMVLGVAQFFDRPVGGNGFDLRCPYGASGDRLWVREAFAVRADVPWPSEKGRHYLRYRADGDFDGMEWHAYGKWRPSIHLPRAASRITLEVTGVRVERVQEISDRDCHAEGIAPLGPEHSLEIPRREFRELWDRTNAKRGLGWDVNPWVWVIEFRPA